MNVYLSAALCFLPLLGVLALCFAFVRELRGGDAALAALSGLAAVVPITVLQFLTAGILGTRGTGGLIVALVCNALIEEGIKAGSLWFQPLRGGRGLFMLRGALAGLTLGCFETMIYVVTGHSTFLQRLFTAVLLHTECAALSSLTVWERKHWKTKIPPFAAAVAVHGVYNFFAPLPPPLWWFSVAALLLGAIQCRVHWTSGRPS